MDWFSLCLNNGTVAAQGVLHMVFICRLSCKALHWRCLAIYPLSLLALNQFCIVLALNSTWSIAAEAVVLYAMGRWMLRLPSTAAASAAFLAIYITQLSAGIVNSLEIILISPTLRGMALYVALVATTVLSLALCGGCYLLILKFFPLNDSAAGPYMGLLLFPGLFFLFVELYILETAYTSLPAAVSLVQSGTYFLLLSLQILGLGALLCTLYAYRRACYAVQAQQTAASLTQAVQAQKTYLDQAQRRYAQTQAFRHDIKNHLTVLEGLLHSGKSDAAADYLQTLQAMTAALSFPYRTGSPVVDILLSEKLDALQDGSIETNVSVRLPDAWGVDALDLCVIFANALDNAVTACQQTDAAGRTICISGACQGDFYLLKFENTCSPGPLPPMGIGLSNVKAAAEKYHGAILTEKDGGWFRLHVLLNSSDQSADRSCQKPCTSGQMR